MSPSEAISTTQSYSWRMRATRLFRTIRNGLSTTLAPTKRSGWFSPTTVPQAIHGTCTDMRCNIPLAPFPTPYFETTDLICHHRQVLAGGTGRWSGNIVNPSNPQRRDTHILPANGYLVLQWGSDNPGVWPFHCHIAWHISGGLNANFLERPDDIKNLKIPSTTFQNCRNWAAYSGGHIVEQIDSGL